MDFDFFLEIEADNQIKIDRRLASSRWNALEFCAQIENVGKNCEFVISSHTDSCIAQFIDIAARLVCIPLSDLFHRKKSTCTHLNREEGGKKGLISESTAKGRNRRRRKRTIVKKNKITEKKKIGGLTLHPPIGQKIG